MDDVATYALLIASAVFVVLSITLLHRYRQASQKISASTDLGHDLWAALDARLKKQDERILDMMGRVEVIQSRAAENRVRTQESGVLGLAHRSGETEEEAAQQPTGAESLRVTAPSSRVTPVPESNPLQALESRLSKQESRMMELMGRFEVIQSLLESERARRPLAQPSATATVLRLAHNSKSREGDLIQMLKEKSRTSVEIRERFSISREHAARLLKGLFDKGLVVRNDSNKPYVYELTDAGRQLLSGP